MTAILLLMVMVAFSWLVIWVCADRSKPSKTWWPFDYQDEGNPAKAGTPPNDRRPWDRRKPTPPWKRSGF